MDVRVFGLENPVMSTLHHLMNVSNEMEKGMGAPTRAYVQDARAMASTPADIKELPSAYAFIVDMPGVKPVDIMLQKGMVAEGFGNMAEIKPVDIKVQVEDDRVLVIGGERTRGSPGEEDGGKYLRMERRVGKFMRKFALPDNANVDAITAVCQNGLLTVTVQKLPPAEPKKPKTVEVRVS